MFPGTVPLLKAAPSLLLKKYYMVPTRVQQLEIAQSAVRHRVRVTVRIA